MLRVERFVASAFLFLFLEGRVYVSASMRDWAYLTLDCDACLPEWFK